MSRFDTYCGLYCGACTAMRANLTNTLKELAVRFGKKPEEIVCEGCKTDKNLFFCATCEMKACCISKGYDHCGECPEMPCEKITTFSQGMPHRGIVFQNLKRINEIGMDAFMKEQDARWRCSHCGQSFGWYEETCSSCGEELFNANREAEVAR